MRRRENSEHTFKGCRTQQRYLTIVAFTQDQINRGSKQEELLKAWLTQTQVDVTIEEKQDGASAAEAAEGAAGQLHVEDAAATDVVKMALADEDIVIDVVLKKGPAWVSSRSRFPRPTREATRALH